MAIAAVVGVGGAQQHVAAVLFGGRAQVAAVVVADPAVVLARRRRVDVGQVDVGRRLIHLLARTCARPSAQQQRHHLLLGFDFRGAPSGARANSFRAEFYQSILGPVLTDQ